jgi:hypothetical protein
MLFKGSFVETNIKSMYLEIKILASIVTQKSLKT